MERNFGNKKLSTFKGELPPGHSVIPNLMLYEVAKREREADAKKYFDAAFRQMEWMIAHLDWNDPLTKKGQRLSERITMRAFAYFYHQFPNQHPNIAQKKIQKTIYNPFLTPTMPDPNAHSRHPQK